MQAAVLFLKHVEPGRPLDRQGMHCKRIRRQSPNLLQCAVHILQRLLGKSHDQIHIDVVKAQLPGHVKFLLHHVHSVAASDEIQGLLVHSLGIDGDAGDAVGLKNRKLLPGDAVRPSRLHGKFQGMLRVKQLLHTFQKPIQFLCLQGCGSPASYVDRIQRPPGHPARGVRELLKQGIQIKPCPSLPLAHRIGREGAVQTGRRTKWDSHI